MADISAQIEWHRGEASFSDNRYSRLHRWRFDGGAEMQASSSPLIVPVPMSDESVIDPEEAFVASLSSCHMLWFLAIAAKRKFIVDSYVDDAVGEMGKNSDGKTVVANVTLRPKIQWSGDSQPTESQIEEMHERAHAECFIANSVTSDVHVQSIHEQAMDQT